MSKMKKRAQQNPAVISKSQLITLFVLIIAHFVISTIERTFIDDTLTKALSIILSVAIVGIIIRIVVQTTRHSLRYLLSPDHLPSMVAAYAVLVLVLILLFSTLFSIAEITKTGYLQYGGCNGQMHDPSTLDQATISKNFIYFSTVTFFTVGYGDICPMGSARALSMIEAFVGHVTSVIIVALIINNYLQARRRKNGD